MGQVRINLSKILDERGMSQKDFSELSGLSENAVSKICNQQSMIKLDTIAAICSALDIQPEDLIEYIPDIEANNIAV